MGTSIRIYREMKKLLISGFASDYGDIDIESLSEMYNVTQIRFSNVIRSLLVRIYALSPLLFTRVCKLFFYFKLKGVDADYLVSDDNLISMEIFKSTKLIRSEFKKILLLRNTITKHHVKNFIAAGAKDVKIFSFDEKDCLKYNISYINQFTSGFYILRDINQSNDESELWDFYFLGLDKGRNKDLKVLKNKLNKFRCNFHVVQKNSIIKSILLRKKSRYIPYKTHLNNVIKSKVLVEVVSKEQSGITMRVIEALAGNKKIISNNMNLKTHSLYHSDYFYLVASFEDIIQPDLDAFLTKGVSKTVNDEIENYSVQSVFNAVLGDL